MNIFSCGKELAQSQPQIRNAASIPTAKAGGFTRRFDNYRDLDYRFDSLSLADTPAFMLYSV
jgi:hypothetical protein